MERPAGFRVRARVEGRTARVDATAVFDEQTERVTVAGQVLIGRAGVEGVALRISLGSMTRSVLTGPHGCFGVRFDAATDSVGSRAVVRLDGLATTCEVC